MKLDANAALREAVRRLEDHDHDGEPRCPGCDTAALLRPLLASGVVTVDAAELREARHAIGSPSKSQGELATRDVMGARDILDRLLAPAAEPGIARCFMPDCGASCRPYSETYPHGDDPGYWFVKCDKCEYTSAHHWGRTAAKAVADHNAIAEREKKRGGGA